MSRRGITRIDYSQLNSTGRIIPLRSIDEELTSHFHNLSIRESIHPDSDVTHTDSDATHTDFVATHTDSVATHTDFDATHTDSDTTQTVQLDSIMAEPSDEAIDLMILAQDAIDMMEEIPINDLSPEDSNVIITKLEQIRSSIRKKEVIIKRRKEELDEDVRISVNQAIMSIKEFITGIYDRKSKANLSQTKIKDNEAAQIERKINFRLDCINRDIEKLEITFDCAMDKAESSELLLLRKNLSSNVHQRFDKITESYTECLDSPIKSAETLIMIRKTGQRYVDLDEKKQAYVLNLTKEISKRELDKHSEFNKSKLNIKLEKFSGYDSNTDFYTFRTNFEKMHLSSTPKELLPDLLRNNYLTDAALTMVKTINNIDEIWERLKKSFGDSKVMLSRRLHQLKSIDFNKRDPEKLISGISTLINIMQDVSSLAEKHNIEEYLYYGSSISDIHEVIGERRSTQFLVDFGEEDLSPKETWQKMIEFLIKERRVNEQKRLLNFKKETIKKKDDKNAGARRNGSCHWNQDGDDVHCSICNSPEGRADHIATKSRNGKKIMQYYTCKSFVFKSPEDRYTILKKKGFCAQCLFPGADASSGKHVDGKCQHDFVCAHPSHQNDTIKKHVLVCEEHKTQPSNQQLLDTFVKRFIKSPALPQFSREIKLYKASNEICDDRGVYLLQQISINGNNLLIFYDNGCSDFVVSKKAIELLGSKAKKISSEPVILGGVGECQTKSLNGIFSVTIPLHDDQEVTFSGVCLDRITSTFPTYPLDVVEQDIIDYHISSGGTSPIPKLPNNIGGEVHMMIGVKYLRHHPKMVIQLPSGLALYESKFNNSTGGRGVVGGPHHSFTKIHQQFNTLTSSTFFSNQFNMIRSQSAVPLLGFSQCNSTDLVQQNFHDESPTHISTTMKIFEEVEATGSEISYRCPDCRNCKACKQPSNDVISCKEEIEQSIINSSITVDLESKTATALLPFIADPEARLVNNKDKAMKTYQQQVRKLNHPNNQKDKQDVLESEAKLQQLGYVEYVCNLPKEDQDQLQTCKMHYYIPWRAVWKSNSFSTPCRIVFDASQPTASGFSLNDVLAKGRNNLNHLQEILIRWSVQPTAIHTDIKKMYNTIKLHKSHWCYQRYLWQNSLDPSKSPEQKVIKTLIYGVKSSSNQAEFALRKIAQLSKEEYPKVNNIVQKDIYVDDCVTGEKDLETAHRRADELELVLNRGGFQLKGIAFSREDPPSTLSDDGETIHVGGMRWLVKSDELALNVGELNFNKKIRGRKPEQSIKGIPSNLTRRQCASKVAELFDLTGKVSPLIASMKIDLQDLVQRQLNWDDIIPDNLRSIWESNFDMMKEIGDLRFNRAIVPEDAIDLKMDTLDFGDASHSMVCVSIYGRFLRRNGEYSCQLIFSRTRTVPKGTSQPRGELYAAVINTHTGEIVKRSLTTWHQSSIKLTDSQIVLHWISNENKPLKQYVRTRVIEIKRFTSNQDWFYVNTNNMIADIGTRKGATLKDVSRTSTWINGFDWMHLDHSQFPIKSAENLKLSDSEISEVNKEVQIFHINNKEFKKRSTHSNYLIDPNHRSFSTVIRILAYVIKFCNITRKKSSSKSTQLTNDEIHLAELYFFKKATEEILHLVEPRKYEPISTLKDGILTYNGRILSDTKTTIVGRFTSAMLDLSSSSFCVPIIDGNSPIAFSIVYDIHWNSSACHSGIETTIREILKKVYIINGRSLVKLIRRTCTKCRIILKKQIEAIMGPIPPSSLTVAPAFYNSQIDLSGPYQSFSPSHKRTTVKIWLVVYCCCSTSAVMINVMDDYSSSAFIQAFTRFSTRYGFPKKVFCDEGSQLVKATKGMKLNYTDVKSRMFKERSVEFQTCPVGGHNVNGKVERKIKHINLSLEKTFNNQRLSILQWETLTATIANTCNNLPLAVGNVTAVENMDLLTPNRLLLGRNNERSPVGDFIVTDDPSKILKTNTKIYDSWFETWLLSHVPKLMHQSKWFRQDRNLQIGDIVLFTKVNSVISKTYTYGMIKSIETGDDGNVRRVVVEYKNPNENVKRETSRSVRSLILVHGIDDPDLFTELF